MQRQNGIVTRQKFQRLQDCGRLAPLSMTKQRVNHQVAHQKRLLGTNALAGEVVNPRPFGTEQQITDCIGENAVDLLGHRAVTAPQPRFDVNQRNAQLHRHQATSNRPVHVTDHQHGVRSGPKHHGLERLHNLRRLHGVASRTHFQVEVRLGNAQVMKEEPAHVLVIVLPRVNQQRLNGIASTIRGHQRRNLHEVGTRPDDVHDANSIPHHARVLSW